MKILCLTTRLDRPSTRYRLLQYIPYINYIGIKTDIVVIPKKLNRRDIFKGTSEYDGVFVQKKLFSKVEQWYLKKRAKKIIFDFDDAIMYTKSKFSASTRRYKRFKYITKIADLVIAGNRYLASLTSKAAVIPTVIDVSKYPLHSRDTLEKALGWIGTKSTQGYLDMIKPVLEKIIIKYPKVKVRIISDEMPDYITNNIVWEKWDKDKEMDQLLSFDIGLAPLTKDPWTEGKCGFKIIQYMAAGIPVVCSPVGVNKEIIKDGVNGFYASTPLEWEDRIMRLIEDINLYKNISIACRDTVEKKYNLAYWGPYLAGIIKEKLC